MIALVVTIKRAYLKLSSLSSELDTLSRQAIDFEGDRLLVLDGFSWTKWEYDIDSLLRCKNASVKVVRQPSSGLIKALNTETDMQWTDALIGPPNQITMFGNKKRTTGLDITHIQL